MEIFIKNFTEGDIVWMILKTCLNKNPLGGEPYTGLGNITLTNMLKFHVCWHFLLHDAHSFSCVVFTAVIVLYGFPDGSVSKDCLQCRVPGSGRSPGGGNANPLQYSCLENPMDRGAWQATVHGVTRVGHNLATKPWFFMLDLFIFPNSKHWTITLLL